MSGSLGSAPDATGTLAAAHRPLTISVVIPVKNDADRLERCLEALWDQVERPYEIVVVDNGSTDLTREVAGWWKVTYVFHAEPGIAAAASRGYDAATGEVIARLDADSVPSPGWTQRVRMAFETNPCPDAVTGPGRFDSLPPAVARVVDFMYMRAYFRIFGRVVGRTPLFGSCFAMRRDVWWAARDRAHRSDPEVHDDLDLSFALAPGSHVVFDAELAVPVSARPFSDPVAFVHRIWRGFHTVRANRGNRVAR